MKKEPKILFLHVGKCGGGSIAHIIKHNKLGKYFKYYHGKDAKIRGSIAQDFIVTCTRDPAERFVSAFNWRRFNVRSRCSKEELKILDHYETPNNLAETLDASELSRRKHAQKSLESLGHIKTSFTEHFGGVDMLIRLQKYNVKFYEIRTQLLPWHTKQANYLIDDTKLVLKKVIKDAYDVDIPEIRIPRVAKSKLGKLPGDKKQQKTHVGIHDDEAIYLSERAYDNLVKWYTEDYKCLEYYSCVKEKGLRKFW